ncbi:hypothetical protein J6590_017791 [Homalodisca vitripennis]|nr:hypothetical protein J6590_017791 [Homalodisca vitripennis]
MADTTYRFVHMCSGRSFFVRGPKFGLEITPFYPSLDPIKLGLGCAPTKKRGRTRERGIIMKGERRPDWLGISTPTTDPVTPSHPSNSTKQAGDAHLTVGLAHGGLSGDEWRHPERRGATTDRLKTQARAAAPRRWIEHGDVIGVEYTH